MRFLFAYIFNDLMSMKMAVPPRTAGSSDIIRASFTEKSDYFPCYLLLFTFNLLMGVGRVIAAGYGLLPVPAEESPGSKGQGAR